MRTQQEIQTEINSLQASMARVKAQARAQGRDMTRVESKLVSDMADAVDEAKQEAPAALTMHGNSTFNALSQSSGPFRNLGEQAQAIAKAAKPGSEIDARLFQIKAATGLGETVPSEGGFLIQTDFSTELLEGAFDVGLVNSRVNRMPISANSNGIKLPAVDETSRADGSRWGGIESHWLHEAGAKEKSKPKFRLMELELKKLIGLCYCTDELLQDATALDSFLRQAFKDEIAFKTDKAIISGTGAGEPLGILNSPSLVSVAAEAGQAVATLMTENVVKMFSRMPARNRRNSVWYINQGIEPQLFTLHLDVGTGGIPVYMPAGGLSGAPFGSLFGRPVIPIEQTAALGTEGDIIFMDPSAYVLIDKGGVQTDVSIHVEFLTDQSIFRFVYRVDGQPSWAAPLTPHSGGATLSPFIALETRS